MATLDEDCDMLMRCNGLFEGLLDAEEARALRRLVKAGWAYVTYSGAAGFLGLGKIWITGAPVEEEQK